MAGLEFGMTRLGAYSPLAEPNTYGRRIAVNAGHLAHQLTFGSDRVRPANIDGFPVSISARVGRCLLDLTRVYGAVLDAPTSEEDRAAYVEVESHTIFGTWQYGDCNSTSCGAGRTYVLVSPDEQVSSRGIRGMTYATPDLASDWQLDRAFDDALDGASGYGDFEAPLDVRRNPRSMQALRHLRLELGHTFAHPALEAYAATLTGSTTVEMS